ncbi:uncharacterized protein LOC124453388 [Xenia sp. Carnegie-2017]|uniref:uncharacterized protein LOC124453388 n=1 Tax=Xenia sp. Carnegie-2017 TaxID=2897299 RepID=UPI001F04E91B|nr:uncharacterized protein LOC124453388 [Xenia sp. Carnegie-2017]XP_046860163.1 uncharacterized protein LOC124453388 [Xenia sp. Carnegie-2017]
MTLGNKSSVCLQFFLYFATEIFNLLTDVGLYIDSSSILSECDDVIDMKNSSELNGVGDSVKCSDGGNFTSSALKNAKTDLIILQLTLAGFFVCGAVLFISQVVIYCKYFKAARSHSFEYDCENSEFLKSFYKIHGFILGFGTILHDIPVGLIVVELCVLVWQQPNCWECVKIFSSTSFSEVSLSKTNLWLGIKLGSLAPITFYKGMLPLFMWIGGPFCGMDCYICRVCTVLPSGFLATVLLLTPICGVITYRLEPIATGIDNSVVSTVWSIGLIFWVIAIIIGIFLCVCCVPACRVCCFRYGICKWCGLDCCGLGKTDREEKKDKAEA